MKRSTEFKILKETFNALKKSNKIFNLTTWNPPAPAGGGMCPPMRLRADYSAARDQFHLRFKLHFVRFQRVSLRLEFHNKILYIFLDK